VGRILQAERLNDTGESKHRWTFFSTEELKSLKQSVVTADDETALDDNGIAYLARGSGGVGREIVKAEVNRSMNTPLIPLAFQAQKTQML
jgi:hypothetical protein